MAEDSGVGQPQFVYFFDDEGFRRQVRLQDVDSVPDTWTPEVQPVEEQVKRTTTHQRKPKAS
jgi:hypothetical protein